MNGLDKRQQRRVNRKRGRAPKQVVPALVRPVTVRIGGGTVIHIKRPGFTVGTLCNSHAATNVNNLSAPVSCRRCIFLYETGAWS